MDTNEAKIYELSKFNLLFLFSVYSILFFASFIYLIWLFSHIKYISHSAISFHILISSVAACLMMSCIKYTRKLYKALIQGFIETKSNTSLKNLGCFIYFLTRPFFSCAFVLVFLFAMLAGMFFITSTLTEIINIRFMYLSIVSSSIIGYSVGDILEKFEKIAKTKVQSML